MPLFIDVTPGSLTGVIKPPIGIAVPGPFATKFVCAVTIASLSKS